MKETTCKNSDDGTNFSPASPIYKNRKAPKFAFCFHKLRLSLWCAFVLWIYISVGPFFSRMSVSLAGRGQASEGWANFPMGAATAAAAAAEANARVLDPIDPACRQQMRDGMLGETREWGGNRFPVRKFLPDSPYFGLIFSLHLLGFSCVNSSSSFFFLYRFWNEYSWFWIENISKLWIENKII